jgi:hypothetical protein
MTGAPPPLGAILPSTERRSAALAPARDAANEPLAPATRHARQPACAWHRQLGAALGEDWSEYLLIGPEWGLRVFFTPVLPAPEWSKVPLFGD